MSSPVKPRDRLSRADYDAAKQAGYSDEEIRAEYDVEDGVSMPGAQAADATSARPDPQKDYIGPVRTAAMHGLEGASLGTGDEVVGGLTGVFGRQPGEDFGKAYVRGRNGVRETLAKSRAQHPTIAAGSEIAGSVAAPLGTIGKLIKGRSLPMQALRSSVVGTISGGVAGAGYSEGQDPEGIQPFPEVLANAGKSAAISGAIGAGLPVAARAVHGIERFGERVGDRLGGGGRLSPREEAILRATGRVGSGRVPSVRDLRSILRGAPPEAPPIDRAGVVAGDPMDELVRLGNEPIPFPTSGSGPLPMGKTASVRPSPPPIAAPPTFSPDPVKARAIAALKKLGVAEQDIPQALAKMELPASVPPTFPKQRGASRGQLQHREDRFGLPKVTPDPPQGVGAPGQLEGEEDALLAALARSLSQIKDKGSAGHLRGRP